MIDETKTLEMLRGIQEAAHRAVGPHNGFPLEIERIAYHAIEAIEREATRFTDPRPRWTRTRPTRPGWYWYRMRVEGEKPILGSFQSFHVTQDFLASVVGSPVDEWSDRDFPEPV